MWNKNFGLRCLWAEKLADFENPIKQNARNGVRFA